ncbi:pyrimidine 5'-nucleotidase [Undibacterium sp. SXout7W]|uniref:pyrimidine 5'-nucleotidase n=1 Tax=Undibacterium sp. SXout7W TaxID=3413049 RepID=UPI003BF4353E
MLRRLRGKSAPCLASAGYSRISIRSDRTQAKSKTSPLWLFDLDNTLHNASHAIFPAINRNMNAYLAKVLGDGITPADAQTVNEIRLQYYVRYGATMLGMVRHHGVRAEDFLHEAHRFIDLPSMIRAEHGLKNLLRRLPGKKILLTNAPRQYSRHVLRHLDLHRHFDAHIAIETMRVHGQMQPKPSRPFLRKLLQQYRINAQRCILVEDSLDNLRAAKREGLKTVLVHGYTPLAQRKKNAACVDVTVKSVLQLTNYYHRLCGLPR